MINDFFKNTIQDKLNIYAQLIRKYNLGDINYLYAKFPKTYASTLNNAWSYARKKIQNKEIVKDTEYLDAEDLKIVNNKINIITQNPNSIYEYLETEFNEKKLKLRDEKIERRVRHILAHKYIEITYDKTIKKEKRTERLTYVILALVIINIFTIPRVIEGLTSVEKLANKYHEQSKYKYRVGAICKDGSYSNSTGKGTCSYHGGVKEWIFKPVYSKSIEECREKAKKRSWRD